MGKAHNRHTCMRERETERKAERQAKRERKRCENSNVMTMS